MTLANTSALLALVFAVLLVAFNILQWTWGLFAWQPILAAASLGLPALLTLQGNALGLRILIAAWGVFVGYWGSIYALPAPPPNPNQYSVDTGMALFVAALPFIGLIGLGCAVLHRGR